jgi:hypothetical protein
MEISHVLSTLILFAFGLALVFLYILVSRHRFGAKLDLVQSLLYRVDTSALSTGNKALEFVLRMLKHLGFFIAVVSIVMLFAGK